MDYTSDVGWEPLSSKPEPVGWILGTNVPPPVKVVTPPVIREEVTVWGLSRVSPSGSVQR